MIEESRCNRRPSSLTLTLLHSRASSTARRIHSSRMWLDPRVRGRAPERDDLLGQIRAENARLRRAFWTTLRMTCAAKNLVAPGAGGEAIPLMPNHIRFMIESSHHQSLSQFMQWLSAKPVRTGLAASVNDWPWSSWFRNELADPSPVEVEASWVTKVDNPLSESQLTSIRESVNRQRPFGETDWQTNIASRFGLESTMRPRGRPVLNEIRR